MSFNTETAYLLWDEEHSASEIRFKSEDANSFVFNDNGTELVLDKENVVNLGSAHPPAPVAREAGKHYVSKDDSGASNQEYSVSSQESENNMFGNSQGSGNSQDSGSSQATGANETAQSGGRRKKGKKTKVKSRRTKAKKTKTKKSKK